jgi:glycosyltransferase involved in cell wall biosynthesis
MGCYTTVRDFRCVQVGGARGRLLIICPGHLPIPPDGWGAVELLIHESIPSYITEGYEVWILNSRAHKDWKIASKEEFKLILNHSDIDSPRVRRHWPNSILVSVTHYGLAAQPEKWHKGYHKVLQGLNFSDKIICLSPAILSTFLHYFDESKLLLSPNGSSFEFERNKNKRKNGPILYLGKVEKRKRQYEVWHLFKDSGIDILFAGPIVDERVMEQMSLDASSTKNFLGEIDRSSLQELFSGCSSLMLISEGEGDALVLYEAQLAGLPILVNMESLGSQDCQLPWVRLIKSSPSLQEILTELESVDSSGDEISLYANANYSWNVRNRKLIQLLNEFNEEGKSET